MRSGLSIARLRRDLLGRDTGLPLDIFLVGGVVRDRLDGRKKLRDIDLAVEHDEEAIARRLSRRGWGKAFRIAGARHGISVWRVAGPNGTVDVAGFGGSGGLSADLARRDFTINAMARDLRTGRLFDPFRGRSDLKRRLIRAVSASNLDDDPLRLLRAYRLAAELNARIDPATRALIRPRADALSNVASERIRDDLSRLLISSGPEAARAIAAGSRDGVLAAALGFPAGRSPTTRSIRRIDGQNSLVDRLALLFRRAGVDAAAATRLVSARRFGGTLARIVGARVGYLEVALGNRLEGRSIHRALVDASNPSPDLLDAGATTPAERSRARRVRKWLGRAQQRPLPATGDDISGWLSIPPGPRLGHAIAEARYRYFIGEWSTRPAIRRGLRAWISAEARIDPLPGLG